MARAAPASRRSESAASWFETALAHHPPEGWAHAPHNEKYPKLSFRGARSASPESITTDRGYGFRACAKWRIPE
jgi:hypothetical protein